MFRVILISAFVLLIAAACAPASAAFQPGTPYEPTLGPTPAGMLPATLLPPPSATAAPSAVPTEEPTSSAPPTDTPTATPTVLPHSVGIVVGDTQVTPSQITLTAGQFVRLIIQNQGSVDYDLTIKNVKPDDVSPDESMAGNISREQLDKVNNDAGNGAVHLLAAPQGTAIVTFTPNQKGSFPFTVNIAGHPLSGTIVVQ